MIQDCNFYFSFFFLFSANGNHIWDIFIRWNMHLNFVKKNLKLNIISKAPYWASFINYEFIFWRIVMLGRMNMNWLLSNCAILLIQMVNELGKWQFSRINFTEEILMDLLNLNFQQKRLSLATTTQISNELWSELSYIEKTRFKQIK